MRPPQQLERSEYEDHIRREWKLPRRYEFRQVIGKGSYGYVIEAYDHVRNELVAIKRVNRVFEDLIDCKRILREVAILSALDHDCVVQLYDICVPEDQRHFDELYIVLEICDSDFKKLLKTGVHLTEVMVKTLIYNMLCGMKYVHSAGIYHRDMKPANCLVNQDCAVKVCDFGLARTVGTTPLAGDAEATRDGHSSATSGQPVLRRQLTGHVVTRWYRAPELILLQPNYNEGIDVWSMGCVAAEVLCMMKENAADPSKREPLFPGSSCFPLSPEHKQSQNAGKRDGKDQLSAIFGVIGIPSPEEVEELEGDEAKKYISCFPRRRPQPLEDLFRGSSAEALDLLRRMLTFSPKRRITVDEALSHPYFADIRHPEQERVHTGGPINLPFESEPELDEAKLRRYALLEIKKFHPEVMPANSLPWRGPQGEQQGGPP